jgi:hypothetical protein
MIVEAIAVPNGYFGCFVGKNSNASHLPVAQV